MAEVTTAPCCVCGRDLNAPGPGGLPVNRRQVGDGRECCAGCEGQTVKTGIQPRNYADRSVGRQRRG